MPVTGWTIITLGGTMTKTLRRYVNEEPEHRECVALMEQDGADTYSVRPPAGWRAGALDNQASS